MNEIVNYYDNLAEKYDEDRFNNSYGKFIDKQERFLLDKLISNENEIVLDLACGSGRLLNYAQFGVDASTNMVAFAKQKYNSKKIVVSDAAQIPFESNSIDTIICFHLFMHLNNSKINAILKESKRVLKKNGRLIFDIPSKKRRNVLQFKTNQWHGAFSATFKEIELFPGFELKKTYGILFFPIHRLPKFLRNFLTKLDLFIANSFLKEYSSYLIIELINKQENEINKN